MKITILGTGDVGQTFATKLIEFGHDVILGTRNPTETMAKDSFKEWYYKNNKVLLKSFNEACELGELIINALKGEITLAAFNSINKPFIDAKIIIDVANPLDFSKGFPPMLIDGLNNSNSLGETLQNALPNSHVVKTLNTMWCGLMLNPKMIGGGNHQNFICGNNAEAKQTVINLITEFGWKKENTLDLGDITNARGTEAVLPIWIRIYGVTQNGVFNFALVK